MGVVESLPGEGLPIQPLISHIGMLKVDDGAVAYRGKDIVALVGSAHGFQHPGIFRIIARSSHKRRHRAPRTCPVSDDTLGIARHLRVKMTKIAYGSLEVEYRHWRTSCEDALSRLHALMGLGIRLVGNDR